MTSKTSDLERFKAPKTIGQHLKRRRYELKLTQAEVATLLNVSEDAVTYWENERSKPQISFYPSIISFLGYNPSTTDETSLGGRIKRYRIEHGVSQEMFAEMLGVNESTVYSWEKEIHKPLPTQKKLLEALINPQGL